MELFLKRRHTGWWWLCFSALVIGLDRWSKLWVLNHLTLGNPLPVLPVLNLTLAYNTGAAFSFLHNATGWQNVFFSSLAFLVSGFIVQWLSKHRAGDWLPNLALSAILGGALGNVWDRLTLGYVIDFMDVHWGDWHFAIFNVADSAICVGALLMIFYWMRQPNTAK